MSTAGAAGRAFLLLAAMAPLAACGPAPGAPSPAQILPESGPLAAASVKRLLLVDAARAASRIVAVGDHGYIVHFHLVPVPVDSTDAE